MRMKKSIDALVAGDNCTKKYRENDGHACKVFDTPVTKCKSLVGLLTRKKKRNAKRDRCRGVSKIMNSVRQQTHAARHENDPRLHECRRHEHNERPFERPKPFCGCGNGGVDNAMAVTMVGVFSKSRMLMVVALATMTMVIGVGIMLMRHDTLPLHITTVTDQVLAALSLRYTASGEVPALGPTWH